MVEYDRFCFKLKEKTRHIKKKKKTYNKKQIIKNIKGVALENKIGQQKSTWVDYGSKKSIFRKPIKPIKSKNILHKLQKHAYLLWKM